MKIAITCNRYKPSNPKYVLDKFSKLTAEFPDGMTLEGLLQELGVDDKAGKLFRVNKKALFEYDVELHDGDGVEIFQMFAAG